MPLFYRSMRKDADGLPQTGTSSNQLGVRIPPNEYADVVVDQEGCVALNRNGMSVVSHWRYLKPHQVPTRFMESFYLATGDAPTGRDFLSIFRYGSGEFTSGPISGKLFLDIPRLGTDHGHITPIHREKVEIYLESLASTRPDWIEEDLQ
ncbi:MAG: hypothetical protein WEB58_02635 [Planctomycetaceae bacterium]